MKRTPEEMRAWTLKEKMKRHPGSRKVRAMLGQRPPVASVAPGLFQKVMAVLGRTVGP